MIYTTGPSFVIALGLFTVFGLAGGSGADAGAGQVEGIVAKLEEVFVLHPVLLLPPILVLVMVVMRVPALPAMFVAAAVGGALAMIVQGTPFFSADADGDGTAEIVGVVDAAFSGYTQVTGLESVDKLLSDGGDGRGGMDSMFWTISLVLCAMVFGGVMERTGMLAAIATAILRLARDTGSLIASTAATCLGMNVLASDQYLSIVVPGRMFREAYEDRGLAAKNLSRVLEDAGTITSPLIGWNTCGATMAAALTVSAGQYWMFCFFNLINPVISVVLGLTGWTIAKTESGEESNT